MRAFRQAPYCTTLGGFVPNKLLICPACTVVQEIVDEHNKLILLVFLLVCTKLPIVKRFDYLYVSPAAILYKQPNLRRRRWHTFSPSVVWIPRLEVSLKLGG